MEEQIKQIENVAASYVRCSTNRQDLESQEKINSDWAKRNNKMLIPYSDFAISGKTSQRAGMDKLLTDADKKLFSSVVVPELSRIGRSMGFIYNVIERLNKLNIKVILAQTGTELNSDSVEGTALLGGLSIAAAIELKLIEERNRRGREKIKRDKIKVGRKPSEEKGINLEAVLQFRKQGKGIRETARLLNTSAPTIMRMLKRYEDGHIRNDTISNQNSIKTDEKEGGVT